MRYTYAEKNYLFIWNLNVTRHPVFYLATLPGRDIPAPQDFHGRMAICAVFE